ncbi:MAG: hypothetical protein LKI34_09460 [Bifidobacterium tibiigranuli]|jgi:hypothetical protein|uniref:hypothetical protein n=1 Tax=Bifidobacterium tibiigranuli TaxID=2172043 RepID=UPI0026F12C7A|nr:hypothetical protein [Bifidobacterium tibiigranuli]MCI1674423.1 hypothetical protein [Bifidobacterium tibiigranuli]MCI1713927.1 hypothetical protein [Bifidobacterium tibiigranuli]MCI1834727.1 hypothetical protein [Bifidobacterium tibiigranuli]
MTEQKSISAKAFVFAPENSTWLFFLGTDFEGIKARLAIADAADKLLGRAASPTWADSVRAFIYLIILHIFTIAPS